ncbi:MAG: Toxin-antitoxin protein [candidate division WS6 bacterium GW2011_GWF2_39_15]|uniref:Toxin-antitoxin protein n=1 Tax=candidate division WS6 bacterium GW2011_GWF2_39_15 TaxID=1619100 RepID=A0A0G0QVI5_9BACT|nr:MAG: Toxin-antitoxin protein [candidate division WS6 bacterium GW2011_GWF2_39_15]
MFLLPSIEVNRDYYKEFDKWNKVKKFINERLYIPYYSERDVWWANIGVNIGYEEDGKGLEFTRPVLIARKLGCYSFLGIPLSTKLKVKEGYVRILLNDEYVSALILQIRVFSSKRLKKKMGKLDGKTFARLKETLSCYYVWPPSFPKGERK